MAAGGETGVRDVGWWERRAYRLVVGFTPRCSMGQRRVPWVYSIEDAGFAISFGNPGIVVLKRRSSRSKPGVWAIARPT